MQALLIIGWFILLLVSVSTVRLFIGHAGMCRFFPEGYRWWTFLSEIFSLAFFALIVINHPF